MNQIQFKLSYITLAVTNFTDMFVFYKSLGFPIYKVGKDPKHSFAMFDMGNMILALYPKILLEKQSGATTKGMNQAMSLSLNVSNKKQVNDFLTLAETEGAQITRQPFQPAWGGYCGYFQDPEYNLWEIVWHENG